MQHYFYCSSGNTLGLDEYLGFFEVGEDDFVCRYLEVRADGTALRYTEEHTADVSGVLPEGTWSSGGIAGCESEYGTIRPISPALFDAVWRSTRCKNA
jgi:hypothetical protein